MGPAFYVMAILGCGDSETACQQVRYEPARYATADACADAQAHALAGQTDLAFPVVMARCMPGNAALAENVANQPVG